MHYIGIDPGMSGALAVIGPNGVRVYDTPTLQVGKRREYDLQEMRSLLEPFRDEPCLVALEWVHAMPGQGVTSMFRFGEGFGMWRGMIAGFGLSCELYRPQTWKKVMLSGYPEGKGASLVRAKELFPLVALPLKKHHGRAEALLLAEYARRQSGV